MSSEHLDGTWTGNLTSTQLNFLEFKNFSRSLESSLSYRTRNRAVSALINLLRSSSLGVHELVLISWTTHSRSTEGKSQNKMTDMILSPLTISVYQTCGCAVQRQIFLRLGKRDRLQFFPRSISGHKISWLSPFSIIVSVSR